ncbi:hypothetical protein [Pontibacter sp. SGAir0037]|uniref:hypothetical protein n=1 Tax=Pontibacter sp. SGAir0037 TaxID=2571030 RepID=UPI0010CCC5A7|nr:hypothetical protein [Pontibacter sp. SGAir0037]QCR22623.1 hypothetical protein C1N53_09910 [Pontibacter sp. SGAir0037]
MNSDKKDKLNNENVNKTVNEGNKVPNINPVPKEDVTDAKAQAGEIGGIKPTQSGRKGGVSVQDGGQDIGSNSGSR